MEDGETSTEERLRERFHASRFIGLLGISLPEIGAGQVHTRLQVRPDLQQSDGRVHPGVLTAMAEHSAMAAADTRSLGTRDVRTVGIDLAFEVPSESDSLECTARAETETDAEMIVRVEIVSVAGDERRLLVTGTVTVQVDDGE